MKTQFKAAEAKHFLEELVEQFAESKIDQKSTLKLSKGSIEGLYDFAYKFYQNGKYQESVNFFRFLVLIESKNKRNWLGLAAGLKMLQNFEKAIHSYHIASLLDGEDPQPHIHTAECHFSLRQFDLALECLTLAEERAQRHKDLHHLLPGLSLLRESWETRQTQEKVS